MRNRVSTLRLLRYLDAKEAVGDNFEDKEEAAHADLPKLYCTPHTDSGLLTLLRQDATRGLDVLNDNGQWIPASYVSGSIVVNVGDLMAQMSGGRLVATMHRVRSSSASRYSVPFFCKPGVNALVLAKGQAVRYEEFVMDKMRTWVEFPGEMEEVEMLSTHSVTGVASNLLVY